MSSLPPGRADKSATDCAVMDGHISMLIASTGFALTTSIMWRYKHFLSRHRDTETTSIIQGTLVLTSMLPKGRPARILILVYVLFI